MIRTLALILSLLVFVSVAFYVLGDDGMATCQINHSFGVCHDALH